MSGTVHGIWTLVVMISMLGVFAWAWSSRREADFKEAARLALDENNLNAEQEKSA